MSYIKQTFTTGQTLMAEDLNKMSEGIANNVVEANVSDGEETAILQNLKVGATSYKIPNVEMKFKDTVSEDTTQELKEIELNGDKWKLAGSGIIDVETLPTENIDNKAIYRTPDNKLYQVANVVNKEWNPNAVAVPNSGTIEKVYFNTSLTKEEVHAILDTLTYVQTPFHEKPLAPLLFASDGNPVIFAINDGYEITIATDIVNVAYVNAYHELNGFILNEYTINKSVLSEYSGLPIGTQNSSITNLFSITAPTETITKEFKEIGDSSNVVYITNDEGTFTDEEIEILKKDNSMIIALINNDVANTAITYKKDVHISSTLFGVDGMAFTVTYLATDNIAHEFIEVSLIDKSYKIVTNILMSRGELEQLSLRYEDDSLVLNAEASQGAYYKHDLGSVPIDPKPSADGTGKLVNSKGVYDFVKEEIANTSSGSSNVVYLTPIAETGTFTDEEIAILQKDNSMIIINAEGTSMVLRKNGELNLGNQAAIFTNVIPFISYMTTTIRVNMSTKYWEIWTSNLATSNMLGEYTLTLDEENLTLGCNLPDEGVYLEEKVPVDQTPSVDGAEHLVSSKGVYDYIEEKLGDINSILDTINGEEV